jgi:protocatechuate 3,4-dioxygenase beta subunit
MTHVHGLFHDLPHLVKRRQVLQMAALGGAATLLKACDGGPAGAAEPNIIGTAADGSTCIKTPVETAGPFPADGSNSVAGSLANVLRHENIIRQDIRPNLAPDMILAEGVRLDIQIRLVSIIGGCKPVPRFLIYAWHCDAQGRYSIYDLPDANYLRGVVVSDDKGVAALTTIFPGCYQGRWPHIHFEVFAGWTNALTVKDSVLTSQLAMPEATCAAVYAARPEYASSLDALKSVSFTGDGIFRNNTPEQLKAQTVEISGTPDKGLVANVTIALATT